MNKNLYNNLIAKFYSYIDVYKDSNGNFCKMLQEKIEHIERVAQNASYISEQENWSEENCLIAKLCGFYHDIGRFSQYKQYGTFSDNISVNHGEQGFKEITANNIFVELSIEDAQTILDAVRYHNTLYLPNNLQAKSKMFTQLIKDADKIDIFYMLTEAIRTKTLDRHKDLLWDLPIGEANPSIIDKILSNTQATYSEIQSGTDVCLLQLSWIFEINYRASILKIKENQTLELLEQIIPKTPINETALAHIRKYINQKIK